MIKGIDKYNRPARKSSEPEIFDENGNRIDLPEKPQSQAEQPAESAVPISEAGHAEPDDSAALLSLNEAAEQKPYAPITLQEAAATLTTPEAAVVPSVPRRPKKPRKPKAGVEEANIMETETKKFEINKPERKSQHVSLLIKPSLYQKIKEWANREDVKVNVLITSILENVTERL